jgi:hypothetical protein
MTENATRRNTRTVSGRIVMAAAFISLVLLVVFTYYVAPLFVIPYFAEKPRQTEELFDRLEAALLAYRADNGVFPPEDDLVTYRRINKNIPRSRAAGMLTLSVPALTSPVSYIDPLTLGDPYAVPEQFTPPGYRRLLLGDVELALLSSAGPNLIYDIRPTISERVESEEQLREELASQSYDPTNGVKSGGDYWRLVRVAAE